MRARAQSAALAHVPVIIVSGRDNRDQAPAAGAADHFRKPIDHDALLRSIAKILGQRIERQR